MRTSLLFSIGIFLIVCMVLAMPVSAVDNTLAPGDTLQAPSPPDLPLDKVMPGEDTTGKIPPGLGTSSIGVFRPSTRQFIFNTNPVTRVTFGLSTDKPITGDWDGDGKTEIGVFRPSTRQFILLYKDGSTWRTTYGLSTDKPITGDWDGDGDTEIGVFRPSTRQFILRDSRGYTTRVTFGLSTDVPLTINWNDAGPTEIAVWRPSTREFIIRNGDGTITRGQFGLSTDKPFTTWNDAGYTNVGVFRPSTRQFIIASVSTRPTFGTSTDIPVTGKVWATFTTPPPPGPAAEILAAHNYYRGLVGCPNLVWSDTVAASAQSWANHLASLTTWPEDPHSHGAYGENIAWGGISSWTEAVNMWGGEKQYFIYGPFDSVNPSTSSTTGNWMHIGHYTQIVWRNTQSCGCGKASSSTAGQIYVCQYNPPGNYRDQYPY